MLFSVNALYEISGEVHKDSELQSSNSYKKEKSATEPIIVPIVLKMSEFDHKVSLFSFLIYHWLCVGNVCCLYIIRCHVW